uniref:Secreted protein n=1 Tax=Ascaris lumbricoides TaxID=6252 RepID=A0A0M3HQV7_ASCLU
MHSTMLSRTLVDLIVRLVCTRLLRRAQKTLCNLRLAVPICNDHLTASSQMSRRSSRTAISSQTTERCSLFYTPIQNETIFSKLVNGRTIRTSEGNC